MSTVPEKHKADAPETVRCAVITVSDTRTEDNDESGAVIVERLEAAGHEVVSRRIIREDPGNVWPSLEGYWSRRDIDAILVTGGTGLTDRDQTYETVSRVLTKPLPGYGELFRMLSYQQVGAAAMLSRAIGGLVNEKVLMTMPGSPDAVRLAMDKLIVPELSHLVAQARIAQ